MNKEKESKRRVVFVSPLMTVKELGKIIDSGKFEEWYKNEQKKRVGDEGIKRADYRAL